jgi:benzylsuccinate CoA-transferase BbsE subunit
VAFEEEKGEGKEKTEAMLSPYRILDLTDEKGLMCGQMLGSLGADVIMIEKPGGNPARNIGPYFHDQPDPERSLFWFAYNTNKRGITLNIEAADGRQIFKRLIGTADAVIESFAPGYMDKLGLGYAELEKINQGIVMTSITPFGQSGPYRDYHASDLVCWAMGGALFLGSSVDGRPPYAASHIPQAFVDAGLDAACGTELALYWRRTSGEGQHLDVSIQESVECDAPSSSAHAQLDGAPYRREGNRYAVFPGRPNVPLDTWAVKDGYVVHHIFTGEFGAIQNAPLIDWMRSENMADQKLVQLDWAKFEWDSASSEDIKHLTESYRKFFKSKTRAEILEEARKRRIMIQPVCTIKDVREHPQIEAREGWQKVEHSELGMNITYPGGFGKMSHTACKIWRRAPLIGEHNLEIYHAEMGFSEEELTSLRQAGII